MPYVKLDRRSVKKRHKKILSLVEAGKSRKEIANETGLAYQTVCNLIASRKGVHYHTKATNDKNSPTPPNTSPLWNQVKKLRVLSLLNLIASLVILGLVICPKFL